MAWMHLPFSVYVTGRVALLQQELPMLQMILGRSQIPTYTPGLPAQFGQLDPCTGDT